MKLIYQQMLAFFAVVMVTIGIVTIFFVQYATKTVYDTTYSQLENYASTIQDVVSSGSNSTETTVRFLQDSETMLHRDNVSFMIFDSKNESIYPQTGPRKLRQSEWKSLKKGETIKIKLVPKGTSFSHANFDQVAVLKPVFYENKLVYVISAGAAVSGVQNSISQMRHNLLVALLISSIAAMILSYFLARYTVSRINRLRKATHEISQGNFEVQLPTKGNDEIDDLAQDFNEMSTSLSDSNAEIKRQEDRRRQFMADAAHEMRTPLTTINGLLEGLAYDAIPEESKGKSIELMRNETKRLIRLVNENLDYEKIRTNQIPLHEKQFNATEVLNNIISQLQNKLDDAGDSMTLKADPEVMVYADYDRFVQIMFNIMQNAVQFTQQGEITVAAKRGYHEAIFEVSDSGIGMTEEELRNIWERYYKADPSRKNTRYGESGLGMAIVHQLVKQHGGKIEVASTKNVGTTFTVTLPDKPEPETTVTK